MGKQYANVVTSLGIILAVWFNYLLWSGYENYAVLFFLFSLAALTDFVDGQLARGLGIESIVGASMDRFRDKLLILPVFLFLMFKAFHPDNILILSLARASIILIMIIEVLIFSTWVYGIRRKLNIKAHKAGKIKTVMYIFVVAIWFLKGTPLYYIDKDIFLVFDILIAFSLSVSAYFALQSFLGYVKRFHEANIVRNG